jgi:hypothetical protein
MDEDLNEDSMSDSSHEQSEDEGYTSREEIKERISNG